MTRTPGIFESRAAASSCSWLVFFFRSSQGLVTMPAKPPPGVMIWKMLCASGNE